MEENVWLWCMHQCQVFGVYHLISCMSKNPVEMDESSTHESNGQSNENIYLYIRSFGQS